MSESKHTRGPWQAPYKLANSFGIYDQSGAVIAKVTREADAALIASAPDMAAELATLLAEVERLRADLEREVMRLTACDVVAHADTPESAAAARQMHDDYRSPACEAVARRVDECMKLREELAAERRKVEALEKDAARYRWLREKSAHQPDFYSGDEAWMVSRAQGSMGQNFFGEKIDAAIDAALAASQKGGE